MSDLIIKCALGAVVTAVLALFLQEMRGAWAAVCALLGGIALCLMALSLFGYVLEPLQTLIRASGVREVHLEAVLKCIGICYLVDIGAGLCRTCGQAALASFLEMAGKISLAAVCLPLAVELLQMVGSILDAA